MSHQCPACGNQFAQPFVCTSCGAQRLHDATVTSAYDAIKRMRSERDALARDAARYRWGVAHARWIRHEHEAYVAIPVAVDADLSCEAMRHAAIDAAMAGKP